ncbi:cation transporter [Thiomicrorhabdus sp. Milos-T2]|uniref:cation transporter n=1 Tax=Thiomicrorhabdus sp. Milos-T2 TaxID=90814 RepID=UPI000493DF72|nr:cation transporter [Thiomicrorhabdus sp. Milos-T2]
MACNCHVEVTDASQKKLLMLLLSINMTFFVFELGVGWYAESTGLIADSLDMLADALVYAIGIYAIGRAASIKANAALMSGYFQLVLALLIGLEIVRRYFFGSEPVSTLMIVMGILALIANAYCLKLIYKHRNGEVHMRASWIFSANDVIANIDVIISGILVFWLDSRWPDLIIGAVITLVLLYGAFHIIRDAKSERKLIKETCEQT